MEKLACFGGPGSYSHLAALQQDDISSAAIVFYDTFAAVIEAVARKEACAGMVPVENSSTGSITAVYDALQESGCRIGGEIYIPIHHCLLALPGVEMDELQSIYSHVQGLAQCGKFMRAHPRWQGIAYGSTGRSAAKVRRDGIRSQGAIGNRQAAIRYGLRILATDIQDNTTNYTRFLRICRPPSDLRDGNKMTLVLTAPHVPGSLYHILEVFYAAGLNLTHLESRPIYGRPFEYRFYADVVGRMPPDIVKRLEKTCEYVQSLGQYEENTGGEIHAIRSHRGNVGT